MLREVTFGELLFEIDDAEYVDRFPVKLHDDAVVDVREVDVIHLLVVARGTRDSEKLGDGQY